MTNDEINRRIAVGFGVEPESYGVFGQDGITLHCSCPTLSEANSRADFNQRENQYSEGYKILEIYPDFCSSVDECLKAVKNFYQPTFEIAQSGSKCRVTIRFRFCGILGRWLTYKGEADTAAKAFSLVLVKYLEARG